MTVGFDENEKNQKKVKEEKGEGATGELSLRKKWPLKRDLIV
jgi:hypothetical protein